VGPNLIALAIPLFFVGIGIEWLAGRVKHRRVFRLGDALGSMGCGVAMQLTSMAVTGLVIAAYAFVYEHRFFTLPTVWLPWVAALVGVELTYYWWHRLSHEVNLLWAAHVVHHQSEDYNLSTALRQSVTTWATQLPFNLPLALLGVPPLQFAVLAALTTLYQFWIHTELVPPLGALEGVINTPSNHRVHHAINPQYLDRNHGGTFIFWDRMFGTYEAEREPCVYGTTRPLGTFNPLYAQVDTYRELVRNAFRAPTLLDAVKVFFASPAWHPEWMLPGPTRDVEKKYDPEATPATQRWVLVHWALLMGAVFCFIMWGAQLAPWLIAAGAVFILWSLLTLTGLTEGKRWARPLEVARLVFLAGLAGAAFLVH